MRLKHSVRNLVASWSGQIAYVIINYVTLSVFNATLGKEYMGVQVLFSMVLTIMSLSELGIGSAITFALYRPLAEGDKDKVRSLMRLFKRAYITIGVVIITIGAVLAPFAQHLINGETTLPMDDLKLYFFCLVLNSGVSYFFSYKGSLIYADQHKSTVALIQYSFQIAMCAAQIALLMLTHNYLLFLICMIASSLLQNVVIAAVANRRYPYLKDKTGIKPLDAETLTGIKKNIFALVLHRIGGIAANPISGLIINQYVGTGMATNYGIYYNQIVMLLMRFLDQVFDAIVASVGNLAVTESPKRQLEVFNTAFFINALLYAVTAVPLLCLFNVFVGEIWLDPSYEFPLFITTLIVALYFLRGMRSAAISFTGAYGLYWQTRWKAVIETIVLLALSFALVSSLQIAGVVLAGIISSLCVSTVYEGVMLFRHGLKASSRQYFLRFALYTLITALLAFVAFQLCLFIPLSGVVGFLVKAVVAVVVTLAGFGIVFWRTNEFKEFLSIFKRLIVGLKARVGRSS